MQKLATTEGNKNISNSKTELLSSSANQVQLFVYNLSQDSSEQSLKDMFSYVGIVLSVYIPTTNGHGRGYAFVAVKCYMSAQNAQIIIGREYLNG
ncbi:MAG: hypothetical protein EZS28_037270 [Streblomastix strix]|uniref:RRM domain-containing protein n=1 Tax=Streblomastix strix TaxID=222440 RepID=A0A5J4UAF5_9EUKA|nr:MAG: hypothetical protein EZS28_037270 [Streblomastix strix]